MRRLIEVCTNSLVARFQLEFHSDEIWDVNQTKTRLKLNEGQKFLKYFNDTMTGYIMQMWKEGRKWVSGPLDMKSITATVQRIHEILELREQLEELCKLDQMSSNKLKNEYFVAFSNFKSLNCLNASALSQEQWNTAKTKYNQ